MRSTATRDCYAKSPLVLQRFDSTPPVITTRLMLGKHFRKPTGNFNIGLGYSGGYELTTGGDNNIDVESQLLMASSTPFASASHWLVTKASESEESLKPLLRSASSTQHTRFAL